MYDRIVLKDKLGDISLKKEYLSDKEMYKDKKNVCRFCFKTEDETKIDKSSHAISEMIGKKKQRDGSGVS